VLINVENRASMKFLVDRCAGRSLADCLRSEGYDSVYAVSLGPDPGDWALLQRAVSDISALRNTLL